MHSTLFASSILRNATYSAILFPFMRLKVWLIWEGLTENFSANWPTEISRQKFAFIYLSILIYKLSARSLEVCSI